MSGRVPPPGASARPVRPEVGLCSVCAHAELQASARGGAFWRCRRAEDDARFGRYPALPVRVCRGFEPVPEPGPPASGTSAARDDS